MSRGSSKDSERMASTASIDHHGSLARSARTASMVSTRSKGVPLLVQWMWGDPQCTLFGKCSARWNPMRWSKRRMASEVVLELDQFFCTSNRHRPVVIWIQDRGVTECKDLVHAKTLLTGGRHAHAQDWVLANRVDGKGASRWFFAPEVIKKAVRELELNGEDPNLGSINHHELFKDALRKEGYATNTIPSCCQSREVSFASHHTAGSRGSTLQQKLENTASYRALHGMGKVPSDNDMMRRSSLSSMASPRGSQTPQAAPPSGSQ